MYIALSFLTRRRERDLNPSVYRGSICFNLLYDYNNGPPGETAGTHMLECLCVVIQHIRVCVCVHISPPMFRVVRTSVFLCEFFFHISFVFWRRKYGIVVSAPLDLRLAFSNGVGSILGLGGWLYSWTKLGVTRVEWCRTRSLRFSSQCGWTGTSFTCLLWL